jgi:hypothetical protein
MINTNSLDRGKNLRIMRESKGISIILLILLLLCSAIVGGLLSYSWVMSSYYNMPENSTLLVVESVDFPLADFTYFNVTILNPSNSASDANITTLLLRIETENETVSIDNAEPAIPFFMQKGTRQTFRCIENWSNFTDEVIRVEPIAGEASTRSFPVPTPPVKLTVIDAAFDDSVSLGYFNLTLGNSANYEINLTISEIDVFGLSVSSTTPLLPYVLPYNQTQTFTCNLNWAQFEYTNATITVRTSEGYESVYETGELRGASLSISDVEFDYTNTSYFNLTISSAEDSTADALISGINLTQQDGTTTPISVRPPMLFYPFATSILPPNQTKTFTCNWDWTDHRNESITVNAFTHQGMIIQNRTVETPPAIVWNITEAKFDLDHTEHFLVNVTNMPCSLDEINVTGIEINNETVNTTPSAVPNGAQALFDCEFNWTGLIGQNVTLTVLTQEGANISTIVGIDAAQLKILGDNITYGDLLDPSNNATIPYINITISNSNNSHLDVTITEVVLETKNGTIEIDGTLTYPQLYPDGRVLKIGENVTIICPWNYVLYLYGPLTATVYTREGFQASKTWQSPSP